MADDSRVEHARGSARALPDPPSAPRPWLDSYPPGVPQHYDLPAVPFTRLLDDAAQDFPDTTAVRFFGAALSYRELLDQVDRFAAALANLGVAPGDRVALLLPTCPQHVIAICATLRLGAVVVETSPRDTEDDLERVLNDAGCRVVVCLDTGYERLANLKGRLRDVEHIVATSIRDALPLVRRVRHALRVRRVGSHRAIPASEGVLRFTELVERTAPAVPEAAITPSTSLAALCYTPDGRGGRRGVMLSHGNLVASAFQARLWIPDIQAGRESILGAAPFTHAFGLTTVLGLGLLSAATLTLLSHFDAEVALKAIDRERPTLLPATPDMYAALMAAPAAAKLDLQSVRVGLSAGSAPPADVAGTFEERTGAKLRACGGRTETSGLSHANPVYGKAKRDSVGLPVTATICTLRSVDDPSRPAPPDSPGALAVAGPQVMQGYWNRVEDTAAALQGGWVLTGDLARMDEEGYFTIVDRRPDAPIAELPADDAAG